VGDVEADRGRGAGGVPLTLAVVVDAAAVLDVEREHRVIAPALRTDSITRSSFVLHATTG
jgi:hypothetical protein